MKAHKSYEVKEWFANKIANEIQRNISMCEVFAVLKETEKAVYAMLNLGCDSRKCMWVPKSVLIENEIGEDKVTLAYHHETYIEPDYEKAVEMFRDHWNMYK